MVNYDIENRVVLYIDWVIGVLPFFRGRIRRDGFWVGQPCKNRFSDSVYKGIRSNRIFQSVADVIYDFI